MCAGHDGPASAAGSLAPTHPPTPPHLCGLQCGWLNVDAEALEDPQHVCWCADVTQPDLSWHQHHVGPLATVPCRQDMKQDGVFLGTECTAELLPTDTPTHLDSRTPERPAPPGQGPG